MAHFAELDDNNIVLRVVVIGNKDTADRYRDWETDRKSGV